MTAHLNSHLEYYNKVLWYNLDSDRRYLLLDGFQIQTYDDLNQPSVLRSLASVVKNKLIGIAGNSLIFPVAAGVKIDRSYIVVTHDNEETRISLFDHFRPLTPPEPYRISVPTRGVYAEAIQGACDACESEKDNSSQNWEKFRTDEPTPIAPLTVPTPSPTDWKAAFKDFAPPIVNIQNAPSEPAPGVGLSNVGALLGSSNLFRDVTGLAGNQSNAMATYLSNQENAKAFAQMAKEMATQSHNTDNSEKIKSAISESQRSGVISKEDASKLTKDHIHQMINGGDAKKAESTSGASSKPSLTDAAVRAVEQGKAIKAEHTDLSSGKIEKIDIEGDNGEVVLADVGRTIPAMRQENAKACWATAATMMLAWKLNRTLSVVDALATAGDIYVEKFSKKEGLAASEKEDFIRALGLIGEPPANFLLETYIDWLKNFGPLWVTIDAAKAEGSFSPHAKILKKITRLKSTDGDKVFMIFNNPGTGSEERQPFSEFLTSFEQMVQDNTGDLFIQVVHFKEQRSAEAHNRIHDKS